MIDKTKPAVGKVYHVFNKSIADFKIFNTEVEFIRATNMLQFYKIKKPPMRFSMFIKQEKIQQYGLENLLAAEVEKSEHLVQLIAFCLMPTHFHLILKQLLDNGISKYMSNVLNSYARYFNEKYRRKGPLWEGRFKKILVKTDEQLLHLTRYVHLNPVTAYLIEKPERWAHSSCIEYISGVPKICKFDDLLNIDQKTYKIFLEDRIAYQRDLAKIKKLILE